MSSEDDARDPDDAYVHDPASFQDGNEGTAGATGEEGTTAGEATATGAADAREDAEEFGTRGWVLLGAIVLSFFVVPGIVIARPPGLPFEVALLVLPLLPAILLGVVAVWAMAGRG